MPVVTSSKASKQQLPRCYQQQRISQQVHGERCPNATSPLTSADLSFFLFMAASSGPVFCFLAAPLIPPLPIATRAALGEAEVAGCRAGGSRSGCSRRRRQRRRAWQRPAPHILAANHNRTITSSIAGLTRPGDRFCDLWLPAAAPAGLCDSMLCLNPHDRASLLLLNAGARPVACPKAWLGFVREIAARLLICRLKEFVTC